MAVSEPKGVDDRGLSAHVIGELVLEVVLVEDLGGNGGSRYSEGRERAERGGEHGREGSSEGGIEGQGY